MLSEEQHILIDKFFGEELTAEETQQFQNLLRDDAMFRSEVELQQQVILGIGAYGAQELKAELSSIHSEVKAELKDYKPSQGGGGSVWSAVKLIVTLGVLGAAGYFGYKYYTEHKQDIHQQIKQMDEAVQPQQQPAPASSPPPGAAVKRDTVWHTIKVVGNDTVIYGEKDLEEYMKKNAAEGKEVKVRRDSIKIEYQLK